jgi:hypothetical protein
MPVSKGRICGTSPRFLANLSIQRLPNTSTPSAVAALRPANSSSNTGMPRSFASAMASASPELPSRRRSAVNTGDSPIGVRTIHSPRASWLCNCRASIHPSPWVTTSPYTASGTNTWGKAARNRSSRPIEDRAMSGEVLAAQSCMQDETRPDNRLVNTLLLILSTIRIDIATSRYFRLFRSTTSFL